jgi:translation initiation factor IF-2
MTPTTINKTPRLLEAAKEFNIGRETLVAFLTEKGFPISSNPATKLTEKMYSALQVEFASDKAAKRKSDEIALPRGRCWTR